MISNSESCELHMIKMVSDMRNLKLMITSLASGFLIVSRISEPGWTYLVEKGWYHDRRWLQTQLGSSQNGHKLGWPITRWSWVAIKMTVVYYQHDHWLVSNFIPTDSKKFEFQNFNSTIRFCIKSKLEFKKKDVTWPSDFLEKSIYDSVTWPHFFEF